jgi:hypothetical protein
MTQFEPVVGDERFHVQRTENEEAFNDRPTKQSSSFALPLLVFMSAARSPHAAFLTEQRRPVHPMARQ